MSTDDTSAKADPDEEREFLATVFRRMPFGLIRFDANFAIIDWNPAAERIFGFTRDEMLGHGPPWVKIVPASFWPRVMEIRGQLLSGDMAAHSINRNLTKDERVITCEWFNTPLISDSGRFLGTVGFVQDVTERLRLEEQLRQVQKMEAIGRLAGGVAHDFNNMLTIIIGNAHLLLEATPPHDPKRSLVEELCKAGERSAALTRQLLTFSRVDVLASRLLSVNDVVRDTDKMLRRVIGEDVQLTTTLDPRLDLVQADPGQLAQVLLNVALNARDAMPQGGELTIRTDNVELSEAYARTRADVGPGRYVVITLTDTGSGMTEAVQRNLFEPFFTTKPPGKGTGLGLAVVHGIVKQSHGHIDVSSTVGSGTTFQIYLPRAESVGFERAASPRKVDPAPCGTETILLVEDEDGVRALARNTLQECGYSVLEASQGADALRIAANHPNPIGVLVTDVVMPHMGGHMLAERLLAMHPETKVLYVSGYTDDAMVRHGVQHEQAAFLPKPFSPMALAYKVREVLARSASTAT
jgi:PAS domain S-box-containing protein